jgi:hypothetical protein
MIRRLLLFLVPAALGPLASVSAQRPHADRCRDQSDREGRMVCESLHLFGLPPAEARLAAGEEIRRVFMIGGWGNPIIAVEYRRAPGREPSVSIYGGRDGRLPAGDGFPPAVLPLAEWERLGAAGRLFDRVLAPRPAADGEILVCADGYGLLVEMTDPLALVPGERLRRKIAGSCPDNPASAYAQELVASAARLLPACAGLEPRWPGNEAMLLRDCMTLAGDRMAAAEVHNRLEALRRARTHDQMSGLFAPHARIDWQGRANISDDAAAELAGHFSPRRLIGESARRVRVEGILTSFTRAGNGPEVRWEAPVTLIFADPPSQSWQIADARVGAFAPAAAPLYPRPSR